MDAIFIKDLEVYMVKFSHGEYYQGDIFITKTGQEVEMKSIENITKKHVHTKFSHYESSVTGAKITGSDYASLIAEIRCDSEGDPLTVEDHYKLKGIKDEWQYTSKEVTEFTPVEINVIKIVCDTGNRFIQNSFFMGGDKPTVYTYQKVNAVWDKVRSTFSSLGMEFKEKVRYEGTKKEKIWSGDNLKYIVAFGTYLNLAEFSSNSRGTLEMMEAEHSRMVKEVDEIIRGKYNLHFGKVNLDVSVFVEDLEKIYNSISAMDVKMKSESKKRVALRDTKEVLDQVNSIILKGVEE